MHGSVQGCKGSHKVAREHAMSRSWASSGGYVSSPEGAFMFCPSCAGAPKGKAPHPLKLAGKGHASRAWDRCSGARAWDGGSDGCNGARAWDGGSDRCNGARTCWHAGVLVRQLAGMLVQSHAGMLARQLAGMLTRQLAGMLACWCGNLLACMLVQPHAGMLACWHAGTATCWHACAATCWWSATRCRAMRGDFRAPTVPSRAWKL